MDWISPRIWRSAESEFNNDEPLHCAENYTREVLEGIRDEGFDAIWMRGKLFELIRSEIYPELNDAKARERISNLQRVIADGKAVGVKVYLYFNEPLAFAREHSFWKSHPELAGEPFVCEELEADEISLCTSRPEFKPFFSECVTNLYDDLIGLGGVILITASEYHTHCWSHKAKRRIGDKYVDSWVGEPGCVNCKDREPADVAIELISYWQSCAERMEERPEVWAWNWSWSMWYEEPQREVIEKLPKGVKLMCDFERGGYRKQAFGDVFIDEYSLGFVGPGDRFLGSRQSAMKRGTDVCVKLQLGVTHELATMPNLPLITNFYDKLRKIDELGISGIMGSWNLGNSSSLNTGCFRLFGERADLRSDKDAFLRTLAEEYFDGLADADKVMPAWELFCEAFGQFPFSIPMLYSGPMNYSVAYPLSFIYEDRKMGPSWIYHQPFGDRLEDCFGALSLDEICGYFKLADEHWQTGMEFYEQGLDVKDKTKHIFEELSCARMIGCHLSAARGIFEFHRWRRGVMTELGLEGACTLVRDERADEIFARHLDVLKGASVIARADDRLGYHQEPHAYFYTADVIDGAIEKMMAEY